MYVYREEKRNIYISKYIKYRIFLTKKQNTNLQINTKIVVYKLTIDIKS